MDGKEERDAVKARPRRGRKGKERKGKEREGKGRKGKERFDMVVVSYSSDAESTGSVAVTWLTPSWLWQLRLFLFSAGPVQSWPQTNCGLG